MSHVEHRSHATVVGERQLKVKGVMCQDKHHGGPLALKPRDDSCLREVHRVNKDGAFYGNDYWTALSHQAATVDKWRRGHALCEQRLITSKAHFGNEGISLRVGVGWGGSNREKAA